MSSARGEHRFQWNQWLAAIAASSAMFGVDLDIVWYGGMKRISLEEQRLAIKAVASTFVVIGAIIGAIIADIFGHRRTLLISSILVIPRMADPYLTTESSMWINMILISFGSGVTCVVVPLYISKIADTNNRRNLMVLQLSVHSSGHLATWAVDGIVSPCDDCRTAEFARSALLAISMLFHVIIVGACPETPCYLHSKRRTKKASKSLAFFKRVEYVRSRRDPKNRSENLRVKNNWQGWYERKFRIVRSVKDRNSLAIIFLLIAIRRASRQERNSVVLTNMTTDLLPILGFCAATSITSVFVMLRIDVFERKLTLLFTTLGSLIIAIIDTSRLAKYSWILAGVISTRQLCHLILIGVTLAYTGALFSTNFRAIGIALVISYEVVTRNIFFFIDELSMRSAFYPSVYIGTLLYPYSNYAALGVAFFFMSLTFFPRTNRRSRSKIATM